MKKESLQGCSIARLSKDSAYEFIGKHFQDIEPNALKNLRSFGVYRDGVLLGAAVFCTPRTRTMVKRYTAELLGVKFETEIEGGPQVLMEAFMASGAWDVYAPVHNSVSMNEAFTAAGLNFVPAAKANTILVRNGITYEQARNNWRDWFDLDLANKFGPYELLKVDPSSSCEARTNVELFLEDFGYHREVVPETPVYEWINPDVSFYIYKVASTTNDGYYIGRRVIKLKNPTVADCMNDGYMGSGGQKFKAWLATSTKAELVKTVLSIHSTWEEVVKHEREEIGDLYLSDPNCMNFISGGVGPSRSFSFIQEGICSIHGATLHNGSSCLRCSAAKSWSTQTCEIHGETLFRGVKCERCSAKNLYSTKTCPAHGEVMFRVNSCLKCISVEILSEKVCPLHGATLHLGETCATCTSQSAVNMRDCTTHGLTKHQGTVCNLCNSQQSVSTRECSTHGSTKFQGDVCMRCNAEGQIATKACVVHGEVTHKGNACTVCTAQKAVSVKECAVHGATKHQGTVCNLCNSQASVALKICPIHGETKHQGNTCNRCNAQASVATRECPVHGESKFQGEKCVKCRNAALIGLRDCPVHGKVKHRGKSCYPCVSDRRRARKEAEAATFL